MSVPTSHQTLYRWVFFSLFVLIIPCVLLCCWATDVLRKLTVSMDAFPPCSGQHKLEINSFKLHSFFLSTIFYSFTWLLALWELSATANSFRFYHPGNLFSIPKDHQPVLLHVCFSLLPCSCMNLLNGLSFNYEFILDYFNLTFL